MLAVGLLTCSALAVLIIWAYHYYKVPSDSINTFELAFSVLCSPPRRLSITASYGAGKTTLAKQLSTLFNIPHIEVDSHKYGPKWVPYPTGTFVGVMMGLLGIDEGTHELFNEGTTEWTVDGNSQAICSQLWNNSTAILWLDYHFSVVFIRLLWRTIRRAFFQEVLWHGNKESIWIQFFTKHSLLFGLWITHKARHDKYSRLFATPEYKYRVIRLVSPEQTRRFVHLFKLAIEAANKDW